MFGSHRRDLIAAHEREVKALKMVIETLADEVDYLRALHAGAPHIPASRPSLNPSAQPPQEPGFKSFLSEEEEDLLALRINDYITDPELDDIRRELRLPSLEPDV